MIKNIRYLSVMLLSMFFLNSQLMAQIKPGVLHIKKNNYNSYVNLGIDLKEDLLDEGNAGEATLEFWIKSTQTGNSWTLSDLSDDDEGFQLNMSNENSLTFGALSVNAGILEAGLWHHVAISIQAGNLSVYVNSLKVITDRPYTTHASAAQMHLLKSIDEEIMITEIRGWTSMRTDSDVEDNQWRSYIFESDFELADLKSVEGLEIIYGTGSQNRQNAANLPVTKLQWRSLANGANGLASRNAKGIAEASGIADLLEVSEVLDHPVLGNQTIFLNASKGEHDDKITLDWPHIANIDGYNIYKNRTLINTIQDVRIRVSERISFEDESVLPGELYAYRVEGYSNEDNALRPDAVANGFIFPNGRIEGNTKTESEIFVENVQVTAVPENGIIPGSALVFTSTANSIDVNQIQVFRDNPAFTIEFWYRSDNASGNEVFRVGPVGVQVGGNNISVMNNSLSSIVNTDTLTTDSEWHHIAVVLSDGLNQIYRDGSLAAENTNSFNPELSGFNKFSLNSSANSSFEIDEFRTWAGVRSAEDIYGNYGHILSGRETGLLLYYRFDMEDGSYIYNQAIQTKGSYIGKSIEDLTWLEDTEQPDIVYGTFTDSGGNYSIDAINMGKAAEGLNFITSLYKANHTFNPPSREKGLRRSLERDDYVQEADFIDISSLPLAGKVLYRDGEDIYPAIQGTGFTIDGTAIQGADKNLVTDNAGAFSIGAPLGKHQIAVNNPVLEVSPGVQSLYFDGIDDYAITEKSIDFNKNGVISGWIKKSIDTVAMEQTILSVGELKLVLKDNSTLNILIDGVEEIISSTVDNEWNFFAVAYQKSSNELTLWVNEASESIAVSNALNIQGRMILGAGSQTDQSHLFDGNLYLLEYRETVIDDQIIDAIRNGDLIENDSQILKISYVFAESEGASIRSVSFAEDSQDYVLNLNGSQIDDQNIHTYTRKFKYKYIADGALADTEDDSQFDFNVIDPVTDLRFYNETRFGFVGNIVIPCGYNIGEWNVTVKRIDILSPEFIKNFTGAEADDLFNEDHTVFSIEGLIPGKYKIFMSNVADASIQLETPVIDLTGSWGSYEFEYRSPLELDVNFFAEIVDLSQSIENGVSVLRAPIVDYQTLCESLVFEQSKGYLATISTFETYGEEKCYTKDVSYQFSGDMARVIAKTADIGKDSAVFQALNPNFTGDNKRSLSITATSSGRNKTVVLSGYVTGAQQFNTDFSLEAPPNILAVVHDPAGDGSSATLSKGVSFDFTENVSNSGGVDVKIDFSTGLDKEYYTGFWAGVGGGALFMEKVVDTETKNKFSVTENFRFGSDDSKSSSVTLNQSISTSSDGTVPGIASDVYVGYTPIIHLGKGSQLEVVDCLPVLSENIDVVRPDRSPLFSITHQHIKDVTIPNLLRLRSNPTNVNTDVTYYNEQINKWWDIIAANEAIIADVDNLPRFEVDNPNPYVLEDSIAGQDGFGNDIPFVEGKVYFPESIAFSAGQTISYSLADNSGGTSSNTQSSETGISKSFGTSFTVFGAKVNLNADVKGVFNYNASQTEGGGNESTYSFSLTDGDVGDQFDILVKKDASHTYATPVFKTAAGRSMCPYETGTQSREGVEIVMKTGESAFGEGNLDDRIAYKVELRNTQVAPEAAGNGYYKTYNVKAYNRKGAIVRLNGSLLGEGGTTVVLETQGPEAIKDAVISVARNPDSPELTDFEDISIVMYSPCEEGGGSLGFFNPDEAGVQLADTLYLTAKFHRPCVEAIEVSLPQQNWVVNGSSDDEIDFKFQVINPEDSLDNLVLEYADPASNIGQVLSVISYESLQSTAVTIGGNIIYSFTQDVSGLTDGKYKFRLVPSCGTGAENWRSQTATDWISGSIFRSAPIITEVTPSENTILSEGLITATYDRPILSSGVNSLNISLRGILGGNDYKPYSANFNHGADYIEIPHKEVVSIDSAFTVEFWLKVAGVPNDTVNVISKGSNYEVALLSNGSIYNGREASSTSTGNNWTHVAVVYDGNHNIKTYFDEAIVSNLDQAASFDLNDDPIRIGGDGFTGQIDEIRIWNTSRSQADIVSYQKDRLLGNEEGLKAYFVLDSIALEGEAIRDFTGNTSGTLSNSLSWVSGAAAAPIIVEKVIQDVPIDVILSGERQIIINPKSNFPAYYLEGAQLTAFITDQSISDVYGNKAPGKSWHFVIDRNAVRWNRNNYTISQSEGSSQEFSLEIFNEGATDATYELIDLPDWLRVIGKNQNVQYDLPYGFVHAIRFETADWMIPGTYTSHIKAVTYGEDGARTGLESFYLEVEVNCPSPDYSFDSNLYPDQMLVTGYLKINSDVSLDASDVITALIGGEIRGSASPIVDENDSTIQMTVFGDVGETSAIHFKVWDASACKEYDGILETYNFSAGSVIGSPASPVAFTASSIEVTHYDLSAGYHWISFNQTDFNANELSLNAVSGLQAGDSLFAQNGQYAIYSGSWSGTLSVIDPKESYVVYLNSATQLTVTGEVIDMDTNIPLTAGVNWVGYLPLESMPVESAFLSLEGDNNFTVIGKGAYAEYSAEGWVGSLTNLQVGEGYRIVLSESGTLNYTGNAGVSASRNATAEDPESIADQMTVSGWELNQNEFSGQMYVTSELSTDQLAVDHNYLIGAFANGELRGVGVPQKINGAYQYFMVINGDANSADSLEFNLVDEKGQMMRLSNKLKFEANKSVGSYQDPYQLYLPFGQFDELSLSQNYPNPFDAKTTIQFVVPEDGETSLRIYDQTGRQVKLLLNRNTEKGQHQVDWNATDQSYKPGIYFYELIHNGKRIVKKLIMR